MIQFHITVEEKITGQVELICKTPPGSATQREMDVADQLMEHLRRLRFLSCQRFEVNLVKDWKRSNDPSRQ